MTIAGVRYGLARVLMHSADNNNSRESIGFLERVKTIYWLNHHLHQVSAFLRRK